MRHYLWIIFFVSFSLRSFAREPVALCPSIFFAETLPFHFSDEETRLLCGDIGSSSLEKVWRDIPASQAELSMKGMLQARGYLHPKFDQRDGILYVTLGDKVFSQKILTKGLPEDFRIDRKHEIVGRELTPAKLNELQDWVTFELRHVGYPCPEVHLTANENTGEILVDVEPGLKSKILSVGAEEIPDLTTGVVRRYDAFQVDDYFDIWNVVITERRSSQDELIIGSHFNRKCNPEGVSLFQKIQPGLPRLLNAGIGLDTEQGPLVKLSSHYSRISRTGSSIDNTLYASFRIQDFVSNFNWYLLKNPSRFYLKPSLEIKRDKEDQYEYIQYDASLLPTLTWDDRDHRWDASLGLSYQDDHTVVGLGPTDSRNLFLNESVSVTSHGYEYFVSNPQRGYKFSLNSMSSNKGFVSSITTSKMTLSGEGLFNLGDYSPPDIVWGWRGLLGTTLTPNGSADAQNIPLSLRSFLGGSENLRGFSREELPRNQPAGALTELYLGTEVRLPSLLPWGLQPYTFIEAGALGSEPSNLGWPVYWDPGLGLRWASPIGAFRLEAAHGFADGPSSRFNVPSDASHWQFYVSYGEEF